MRFILSFLLNFSVGMVLWNSWHAQCLRQLIEITGSQVYFECCRVMRILRRGGPIPLVASHARSGLPAVADSALRSGYGRASGECAGRPLPGKFELWPVAWRSRGDLRLSEIFADSPGRPHP